MAHITNVNTSHVGTLMISTLKAINKIKMETTQKIRLISCLLIK